MIYVFDTSAFVDLKAFFPGTFRSLWKSLDEMVADGSLVSVREVKRELEAYNDPDVIQEWAKRHREIFETPDAAELEFVREILAIPHFQALISAKAMLKGSPVADPFVIAAARNKRGTVVTKEKLKANAAKIPNVCHHFNVPSMNLEEFMAAQGWSF